MKTDSLFFRLFATYPVSFFQLIGLPAEESRAYRFDSVEVKQTAFRIDGVFLPLHPQRPIVFAEIQFQRDANLYKRLFSEIFLYLRYQDSNPAWRAVVVFASRNLEPTETQNFQPFLDSPFVQRLYLDELDETEGPLGVDIIRLVVEAEVRAPDRARQLLKRLRGVEDALLRREIVELIETIIVYKFPRLSREEVEAMLGLSGLKQTKVYQEALAEGRQEGRQEGIELGINEGLRRAARAMLANGVSVEQVHQFTKLSLIEIQELQ